MQNKKTASDNAIRVSDYQRADKEELIRLLIELQSVYFARTVSPLSRELGQEKNISQAYKAYVEEIAQNDDSWKVLMAKSSDNRAVGFIIGSISEDEDLVLGRKGKIEDWFVDETYRGHGAGLQLYHALEKWFVAKGCQQVASDTWIENEISIKAHKKLGFAITGIQFAKKL